MSNYVRDPILNNNQSVTPPLAVITASFENRPVDRLLIISHSDQTLSFVLCKEFLNALTD